ncbi:MAG: hypothetical protein QM703_16725 [Gemmatales bacterium]
MATQPSNSVFWYFILAACLFMGSRMLFPASTGCCYLGGRCPVPTTTVPQQNDTIANEQVAKQ